MIEVQQTTQAFRFDDVAGPVNSIIREGNAVSDTLVVSLCMVMRNELPDSMPKHLLTKDDHPVEAFGFDGENEALRESIQIRRSRGKQNRLDVGCLQEFVKRRHVLAVTVVNQIPGRYQISVVAGNIPGNLKHPLFIWELGDSAQCNLPRCDVDEEEHVERGEPEPCPDLMRFRILPTV